jgi:hypothetical protein
MEKTLSMLALQEKFRELSVMLDIYAQMRYEEGLKLGSELAYDAGKEDGITEGLRRARQMIKDHFQTPLGITPVAERGNSEQINVARDSQS